MSSTRLIFLNAISRSIAYNSIEVNTLTQIYGSELKNFLTILLSMSANDQQLKQKNKWVADGFCWIWPEWSSSKTLVHFVSNHSAAVCSPFQFELVMQQQQITTSCNSMHTWYMTKHQKTFVSVVPPRSTIQLLNHCFRHLAMKGGMGMMRIGHKAFMPWKTAIKKLRTAKYHIQRKT